MVELTENEGKKKMKWDGTDGNGGQVANGIYIYVFESPKEKGIGKITIISR